MYHTGSAQSGAAPELGAGQLELLADHPQQRGIGRRIGVRGLAIDLEIECHVVSSGVIATEECRAPPLMSCKTEEREAARVKAGAVPIHTPSCPRPVMKIARKKQAAAVAGVSSDRLDRSVPQECARKQLADVQVRYADE
jgi:hypothetical protein